METDKELSKKARPGELTIRGSMEPEVILPPGRSQVEARRGPKHAVFPVSRNKDGTITYFDPAEDRAPKKKP